MLRVALTGNIASGKSEVAKLFASHGIPVIDADVLARQVIAPGHPAYQDIVARWGRAVLLPDESVDRAALRRIVFNDADEREALNAIVHPRIRALRDELIAAARARGESMVVSDIPLLFETGMESEFDRIVFVDAPDGIRYDRLLAKRGLHDQEARAMMAAQLPAPGKRTRAHYLIENDSTLEVLRERVEVVIRSLESDADSFAAA